jgi:hypothetical protein
LRAGAVESLAIKVMEVTGNWRKLDVEEHNLHTPPRAVKSKDYVGESFDECMHIVGREA